MSDENKTDAQVEEKNKKVRKMNLKELEKAIEKTEKEQGGLFSRYAKELINRKDFLNAQSAK